MIVIDPGIAIRWIVQTNGSVYAKKVLNYLRDQTSYVPACWHTEVLNGLLNAEYDHLITESNVEGLLFIVDKLNIQTDLYTRERAFNKTISLARANKLNGFQATLLELSMRMQLPLATLNPKLKIAAKKVKITVF